MLAPFADHSYKIMIAFYRAQKAEDYEASGSLFSEYARTLDINLEFQHFDQELAALETMYTAPHGGIILARNEAEVIGCVGVRRWDDVTGEIKRMFIKPGYRHQGLGSSLLKEALLLAKECSYKKVKLDTLDTMVAAIHLYKKAGFYETPAYYNNPNKGAVYLEKIL